MNVSGHTIQGKYVEVVNKMRLKDLQRKEVSFLSIFTVSVMVSMLIFMLCGKEILQQTDVLSREALSRIRYQNRNAAFFFFICRERLPVIPILFLLSTTYLGKGAVYGLIAWYGSGIGTLWAIVWMRYGVGGCFLLIGAGFPQYICYIPALVIGLRLSDEKRTVNKRFWIQLFVLELVVTAGCFLEGYVNLYLFEKLLRLLGFV